MKKAIVNFWSKGYLYFLVAGLVLLVFLLDSRIGMYDWGKEIAYFNVIKTSLAQYHSLPLFWWNPQGLAGYPAVSVSSFFLANPETFAFSPFVLLLFWLDAIFFMKFLVCLFCGISILGILCLGKKLHWRADQQRIFAALFLFSPIIIQHLAIGYFPWLNLYLFPWLLLFLLEENPIRAALGVAAVLALTLLQGGLHPFVWFVIFSGFFFLIRFLKKPSPGTIILFAAILVIAVLLSLVRITTSMQTFADFQQKFFNGYSPGGFIRWGLTPPVFTPADMDDIEPYIESYDNGVPYWDGAIYWGGVLPLAVLALYVLTGKLFAGSKRRKETSEPLIFSAGFAALLITLFSFGNLYQNLIVPISDWMRLPALQGMEKYPFRFAILGYLGFSFIVAHYFADILAILQHFIAIMGSLVNQLYETLIKYSVKKWMNWLFVVLVFLTVFYLIALLSRNVLFSWLEPAIRSAYVGKGYPWLTSLMSQRLSIPISAYLQKANDFYAGLLVWFLRFAITGWSIVLLIRFNRKLTVFFALIFRTIKKQVPQITEIILVIPLLFASLMWLRVALATPVKNNIEFSFIPPQMEMIPAVSLSSSNVSISPSRFQLEQQNGTPFDALVFTNIKFSDRIFLKTDNVNDRWFNQNGSLGLIPADSMNARIQVNPEIYLPAFWVTLLAWAGLITFAILNKYFHHKKTIT
jgi:hypothetical protein